MNRPMVLPIQGVGTLSLDVQHGVGEVIFASVLTLSTGMTFRRWSKVTPEQADAFAAEIMGKARIARGEIAR